MFFGVDVHAQYATVVRKNGSRLWAQIKLIDQTFELTNRKGIIPLEQIDKVKFRELDKRYEPLYQKLREVGITVDFSYPNQYHLPDSISDVIVNGININHLQGVEYIEITKNWSYIHVNYGQPGSYSNMKLVGADGNPVLFQEMVEALNFFYRNGWELVDRIVRDKDNDTYRYLLRRRTDRSTAYREN